MKIYSIGLMGFIATVASLVANMQISEQFHQAYPYLFYGLQGALVALFVVIAVYTVFHWDNKGHVSKTRFCMSIVVCAAIYFMGYVKSKYSLIMILACGIGEIFLTRYRNGLIRFRVKKEGN